jgi:hypothetical protein
MQAIIDTILPDVVRKDFELEREFWQARNVVFHENRQPIGRFAVVIVFSRVHCSFFADVNVRMETTTSTETQERPGRYADEVHFSLQPEAGIRYYFDGCVIIFLYQYFIKPPPSSNK